MTRPRCGNDPRAQLTDDDRQAVADFRAYLADRVALRDRIAAAIWERQNPGRRWADCEHPWGADAEEDATAVLAVLPPPADQAAVLRWAADHIEDHELLPTRDLKFVRGADWALNVLRRMADETPAASTAPLASGLPLVKGKCPACGGSSLFLGDGGYVTCSRIDCPEPDAASTTLERPAAAADVEHCVHDRAVHTRHHHTPVTGCPWCTATEARQNEEA